MMSNMDCPIAGAGGWSGAIPVLVGVFTRKERIESGQVLTARKGSAAGPELREAIGQYTAALRSVPAR